MNEITLTFDNGPTPETTPQVLDILAQRNIRANFFVLGQQLANPKVRDLAIRAHAEGHRIGNHTYSHTTPFGELENPHEAIPEIVRTEELIGDLASEDRFFRPCGGGGHIDRRLLNKIALDHLVAENYTLVLWTCVPRDWEDPVGWPERALSDCAAQQRSIVVLHDIPTGAMNRLDYFLDAAGDRGMSFRQDFPAAITPLIRGRCMASLQPITRVDLSKSHPDALNLGPGRTGGTNPAHRR